MGMYVRQGVSTVSAVVEGRRLGSHHNHESGHAATPRPVEQEEEEEEEEDEPAAVAQPVVERGLSHKQAASTSSDASALSKSSSFRHHASTALAGKKEPAKPAGSPMKATFASGDEVMVCFESAEGRALLSLLPDSDCRAGHGLAHISLCRHPRYACPQVTACDATPRPFPQVYPRIQPNGEEWWKTLKSWEMDSQNIIKHFLTTGKAEGKTVHIDFGSWQFCSRVGLPKWCCRLEFHVCELG
jgi:hypothetical protein